MGCRFEFRTQKLPYERISIFSISSILVIRSGYAKKDHISILAVIQNVWDLHKFGLQIWIQNAKITLWKNFGQFFPISSILVIRSYAKKDHISILAVIQKIWDLHKFGLQIWIHNGTYINLGCRFEFRMQKLPYETISGNFSDIIDFVIRSGYAKKEHFSILAVIQNIWDLHKFRLQIWIHNAKITLWKNFGQFFRFHWFWSSGPGMQKKIISQY